MNTVGDILPDIGPTVQWSQNLHTMTKSTVYKPELDENVSASRSIRILVLCTIKFVSRYICVKLKVICFLCLDTVGNYPHPGWDTFKKYLYPWQRKMDSLVHALFLFPHQTYVIISSTINNIAEFECYCFFYIFLIICPNWANFELLVIGCWHKCYFRHSTKKHLPPANRHANHLSSARATIKVSGHQYWWLAGWWSGNRTFLAWWLADG